MITVAVFFNTILKTWSDIVGLNQTVDMERVNDSVLNSISWEGGEARAWLRRTQLRGDQ